MGVDESELNPLGDAMNNRKDDAAPPKLEPLNVTVIKKKKSVWKKGVGLIISEDANTIGDFIIRDVVVPSIKNLLYDISVGAAGLLFHGDSKVKKKKNSFFSGSSDSTYIYQNAYDRMYDKDKLPSAKNVTDKYKGRIDIDDLILGTRPEATEVLEVLCDRVEMYGQVSCQDLYDLLDIGSAPHSAVKWGWKDLSTAKVRSVREGFLIDLPPIVPIDI